MFEICRICFGFLYEISVVIVGEGSSLTAFVWYHPHRRGITRTGEDIIP